MDKDFLSPQDRQKIKNINYAVSGFATLGSIGGIILANKKGGGFWRYVGFFIVGSLAFGVPARLIAVPFKNNILEKSKVKEAEKINKENQ